MRPGQAATVAPCAAATVAATAGTQLQLQAPTYCWVPGDFDSSLQQLSSFILIYSSSSRAPARWACTCRAAGPGCCCCCHCRLLFMLRSLLLLRPCSQRLQLNLKAQHSTARQITSHDSLKVSVQPYMVRSHRTSTSYSRLPQIQERPQLSCTKAYMPMAV